MDENPFAKYISAPDDAEPIPFSEAPTEENPFAKYAALPADNPFAKYVTAASETSFVEDAADVLKRAGTETYRTIVGGVRDAAQGANDLGAAVMNAPLDAFEALTGAKIATRFGGQLPDIEKPSGAVSQITREGVRIGAGLVAGNKLLGAAPGVPALLKEAGAARNMASGAIADVVTSPGDQKRLSDVINDAGYGVGATELLGTKPGDSKLVGKAKDAVEGAIFGGAMDVAVPATRDALQWIAGRGAAVKQGRADKAFLKDLRAKPDYAPATDGPEIPKYARGEAGAINLQRLNIEDEQKNLILEIAQTDDLAKETSRAMARGINHGLDEAGDTAHFIMDADTMESVRTRFAATLDKTMGLAERLRAGDESPETATAYALSLMASRDHQALLSGMASEWGRVGQALRKMIGDAETSFIPEATKRMIVDTMGGKDRLKELAAMMRKLDPAAEDFAQKQGRLIDLYTRTPTSDKVREIFYNSMLSSPTTHIVNAMSNGLVQGIDMVEHGLAAGIGKVRGTADRITAGELKARGAGALHGVVEGWNAARLSFSLEEPLDMVGKMDHHMNKSFKGNLGRVIRAPMDALQAADEFFKAFSRNQAVYGGAYAQALKDVSEGTIAKDAMSAQVQNYIQTPTKAMLRQAEKEALYKTFQTDAGPVAAWALKGRDLMPAPLAMTVAPFIKTPANIMKYAFERVPGMNMLTDSGKAAWKAGGREQDLAIARLTMGTTALTAAGALAAAGFVKGAPDQTPGDRAVANAVGDQPYSVKLGDRWVSFSRLDPLGLLFGIGADAVTLGNALSEGDRDKLFGASIAMISQTLVNKTWAQGVTTWLMAMMLPNQFAPQLENQLGSFLGPAIVGADARAHDQTVRDVRSLWDSAKARYRFSREGLLPKVDLLGRIREIDRAAAPWDTTKGSQGDYWTRFLSPFAASDVDQDPVAQEMRRVQWTGTLPDKKFQWKGGSVKLSPEQYYTLSYVRGTHARVYLERTMAKPQYQRLDAEHRRTVFDMAFAQANKDARRVLAHTYPELKGLLVADRQKRESKGFKDQPSSLLAVVDDWFSGVQ